LFSDFESAVLGVFEWIDGENIQNEQTKIAEYNILGKVYTVPTGGVPIMREDFSDKNADKFTEQRDALKNKLLLSLSEDDQCKS